MRKVFDFVCNSVFRQRRMIEKNDLSREFFSEMLLKIREYKILLGKVAENSLL